jgi:hypothetical protein
MKRVVSLIALSAVLSFGSFTIAVVSAQPALAAKHKSHPKPKAKRHKGTHKSTPSSTTGAATCPTLTQAEGAVGTSYGNLIQTPTPGNGIVCEYTGGAGGNAGVTIFAHESPTVFAGQVAHAPGAPAMPAISGLGNGAFGMTAGGRSVVNAYSNASRTLVAAQAPGPLPPVEALARVALADN